MPTPPPHLRAAGRDHPDGPAPTPVCRSCGYNLSGLSTETCPECGRTGPPATRHSASFPWLFGLFGLILATLFSIFGLLASLTRTAIPFTSPLLLIASIIALITWFRLRPNFSGIDSELSGEWMMAIACWAFFFLVLVITLILLLLS